MNKRERKIIEELDAAIDAFLCCVSMPSAMTDREPYLEARGRVIQTLAAARVEYAKPEKKTP